jgi:hypothetical protein
MGSRKHCPQISRDMFSVTKIIGEIFYVSYTGRKEKDFSPLPFSPKSNTLWN